MCNSYACLPTLEFGRFVPGEGQLMDREKKNQVAEFGDLSAGLAYLDMSNERLSAWLVLYQIFGDRNRVRINLQDAKIAKSFRKQQ